MRDPAASVSLPTSSGSSLLKPGEFASSSLSGALATPSAAFISSFPGCRLQRLSIPRAAQQGPGARQPAQHPTAARLALLPAAPALAFVPAVRRSCVWCSKYSTCQGRQKILLPTNPQKQNSGPGDPRGHSPARLRCRRPRHLGVVMWSSFRSTFGTDGCQQKPASSLGRKSRRGTSRHAARFVSLAPRPGRFRRPLSPPLTAVNSPSPPASSVRR